MTAMADYLDELIPYGEVPTPRGEVIRELEQAGWSAPMIDRYMQGIELRMKLGPCGPVAPEGYEGVTWEPVAP